jgi:hypothetical protein
MSLLERLEEQRKNNSSQEEDSMPISEVLGQAVSNIPSSAGQLVSDITMPIRHPIQTAQSLASLGRGIYQLTTEGEQPDEATAKAVGKFFADRYGSFEGFKKSFAEDPLGIVSDISVVFTGGAGLAAKVPGVAGRTTATISAVGNIIDPVQATGKVISATTKGVGSVVKPFLGATTGTGGDAIGIAIESGKGSKETQKLFTDNLRGNVLPEEIVPKALQAMKDLSDTRTGNYKTNKAELKLESSPVSFQKTLDKINDFELSKQFEGMSELSAKAQKKLLDIKKIVKEWEGNPALHNAKGMDILKRRIDAEYPTGLAVGDSGMVVSEIRNSIKAQILDEVPEYGKVMKDYEVAMKLEKQYMTELSLGKKANAGTTLRKLQSALRNNVNTNYGNRLEMLKNLDPNLVTEIAGQSLSNVAPRGLQGASMATVGVVGLGANPSALAGLPLTSPRLVGETAFKIGQIQKLLEPLKGRSALETARAARVVGEIERASETDIKTDELLELLLKRKKEEEDKGFDSAQLGEIRSDALELQNQYGSNPDDVNSNIIFASTGGDITQGANEIVSNVLQEYKNIFSPTQLESNPLQQEVVSLQRILNQSQNPKSKDQTLKKIQDFQTRLNTNINKSSPKSFEQLALIKMKEVLDGVTYNKLEQGFVNEDKEMLDQLQDATGLYNNYMGLTDKENIVDRREKTANKILQQITNKNYTPKNVVNLLFGQNKFAPNQSLPLVISKLRNTLPQDQFVQVNSLLKDGVLTKVFSGDNNNQANGSMIVKNYNDILNNEKEIINEFFTDDEILKIKQFKQNVIPTLVKEIKLNPSSAEYTMISALAKKEMLASPEPSASSSSLDRARQTLARFEQPLIEQPVETDIEPPLTNQMSFNDVQQQPVTPPTEDLQGALQNFQMPQLNQPLFDEPSSNPIQMPSPTLLPNPKDQEIAMNQQMRKTGIAGLS